MSELSDSKTNMTTTTTKTTTPSRPPWTMFSLKGSPAPKGSASPNGPAAPKGISKVSVLRWVSAVAIAGLALLIALGAMRTYLAHEMTLGLGAVVATAVLLLVGLVSLGAARLRLGRELGALESASAVPQGWLWPARLARLAEIHAAGATPDPEVLADVTRAEEAGRAYLGRYLVATTVLIGLVGTFAGLMQTLGKLTPLLGDARVNGAEVLAAPLAGLHVTFGASLVAILATLALALAQGDLTLCEERVLARLEDRTCHEWIPALWRAAAAPDERVVRAIAGLEVAFADSVSRALAASVQAIGAETRGDIERARAEAARDRAELGRLLVGLEALAAEVKSEVKSEVARLTVEVGSRLGASAEQQARVLEEIAGGQARALARTVDAATESLRAANREVTEAMRDEVTAAWTRSAEAHVALVHGLAESGGAALAQATAAQAAATERATAAVASAVQAVEATAERIGATAAAGAAGVIEAAEASSARAIGAAEAMNARVVAAAEALGARAIAASEGASLRSGDAAEALARETARILGEMARQSAGTVEALAERAGSVLGESVRQSADANATLLRETHESVGRATRETAQLVAQSLGPLFAGEARDRAAVEEALRDAVAGTSAAAERLGTLTTVLEGVGREHTAAMERGGQAVLAAFEQAVVGGGAALDRAATGLATAARDLQSGAEVLGPRLTALGVELGALSREVALLVAARGPDDALGGAVLGELERLGGAVERLGALVRAGRAAAAAAAAAQDPSQDPSQTRSEHASSSGQPDDRNGEESPVPPPPVTRISDEAADDGLRAADDERDREQDQGHAAGAPGDPPPEPVGSS
jgi:DNA anti-recombination protein RmuC